MDIFDILSRFFCSQMSLSLENEKKLKKKFNVHIPYLSHRGQIRSMTSNFLEMQTPSKEGAEKRQHLCSVAFNAEEQVVCPL